MTFQKLFVKNVMLVDHLKNISHIADIFLMNTIRMQKRKKKVYS